MFHMQDSGKFNVCYVVYMTRHLLCS